MGLVAGLLFGKTGYFLLLSWCCLSIVVFMVGEGWARPGGARRGFWTCWEPTAPPPPACPGRPPSALPQGPCPEALLPPSLPQIRTLRLKILSEAAAEGVLVRGAKNQLRMYLTMAVAGLQPIFMYGLTFHLIR